MSTKPTLIYIPGGPGLSSMSFDKLKPLADYANLVYFNPMGTNGQSQTIDKPNYKQLTKELLESIKDKANVILCGHSFGGIQAMDLASQNNIIGVIAISTPVTEFAFHRFRQNVAALKKEERDEAEQLLANNPTQENYKNYHKLYAELYVHNPEDIKVITADSVSVSNFIGAQTDTSNQSHVIEAVKAVNIPKLYITGAQDKVVTLEAAKHEANLGGFKLETINNAGHFPHYEQPEKTMAVITQFLKNNFLGGQNENNA